MTIAQRVEALDWDDLRRQLDQRGHAVTSQVLTKTESRALERLFDDDARFRSTIDMARHRFGDGRYRYFDHPLADTIGDLRTSFYRRLAPIANDWSALLSGDNPIFPVEHEELLTRCRAAGQKRPTPLILRYGEGDWNALHQDLYGDVYFPFQIVTVLSEPGVAFEGGELVLVEQRPRAQSRAHVLRACPESGSGRLAGATRRDAASSVAPICLHIGTPCVLASRPVSRAIHRDHFPDRPLTPPRGAFVIFPTRERPQAGKNGYHRVGLRHGVSTVTRGRRTALGVIFHDAA